MKNSAYLDRMESMFLALGDKTRLRILNLIRGGEVSVWFFTKVLNESQPKISRHLAYLRNAGVVRTRRDGKWIYYSIVGPDDPLELAMLQSLIDSMDEQPELAREYESLQRLYETPPAYSGPAYLEAPEPEAYSEYEVPGSEIDEFLL